MYILSFNQCFYDVWKCILLDYWLDENVYVSGIHVSITYWLWCLVLALINENLAVLGIWVTELMDYTLYWLKISVFWYKRMWNLVYFVKVSYLLLIEFILYIGVSLNIVNTHSLLFFMHHTQCLPCVLYPLLIEVIVSLQL